MGLRVRIINPDESNPEIVFKHEDVGIEWEYDDVGYRTGWLVVTEGTEDPVAIAAFPASSVLYYIFD